MPAITLLKALRLKHPELDIFAIGSYKGIEAELFTKEGLTYKPISTGKLRRYFSWQNFSDLFRLMRGFFQAYFYLLKFSRKNSVIFGTGGFVIVPVVLAAWCQGKRIVLHEQTSRVGLANKIASLFASKILITFEASKNFFPDSKTIHSGYPLRKEILDPVPLKSFTSFPQSESDRPILFLTGGGNGSFLLNEVLEECRSELEKNFFIIHQCGAKFYEDLKGRENTNYKVFPFVNEEMVSLLNEAEVVISRSGAGTVVELVSLGKPSIFIPLKIAQKNEQYFNAREAEEKLGSIIIEEKDLTKDSLLEAVINIQLLPKKPRVNHNPTEEIVRILLGV